MIDTASYLTLAGSPHGKQPQYSALERAKAAHAAGIPAIGVLWNEPLTPKILRYADVTEVEWFELTGPPGVAEFRAMRDLSEYYGCTLVKTGLCAKGADLAADSLAKVALMAHRLGMITAVEPVAWGALSSMGDVKGVMEDAGVLEEPNVGYCYDLWQVAMGTAYRDGLGAENYPVSSIAKVEVSGIGFPVGYDVAQVAMDRPLITSSEVNVRAWVQRLRDQGFTGPVTLEEPNEHLRSLPLMKMAEMAAEEMSLL